MAEMLNSESHYFNSNNSIIINTNNFKSNDLELFLDYSEKSQPSFYYKNEFNLGKVNDFEFSSNIDYSSDEELNEQTFISESDFGDLFNYFDEPSILIDELEDDDSDDNCRLQEEIQLKSDNRKMIRKKKIKKRNNAVVLFNSIKDKIDFFDEIARKENNKNVDLIKKSEILPIKKICSPPPTINRKKFNKANILKEAEEIWKLSLFKMSILNTLLMIDYLPKCIKQNQLNLNPKSIDLIDFYQKPSLTNMIGNKNDFFYSFDFFSLVKYQELYGVKV